MPALNTIICLVLLAAICGGLYLWWQSGGGSLGDEDRPVPAVYTSENVRGGETYHVERAGETMDFEVLSVHWSGYFLVEVAPGEGEELDRDRVVISGWTRALPSNRLIEARHLLELLPPELRYAPSYN